MHIQEIRRQRLIQINKLLSNFNNLPPSLQTDSYKKYLLETKSSLQPTLLVVPSNKIGRIIGQGGCILKQIERDYKCTIKIETGTDCFLNIEGDEADKAVKHIEDLLYNTKKKFNVAEMTDWEKFYVWWAYVNKKN